MANQFLQRIGQVDLISNSENIKKLLAIPFADSHVSMIVHRVGRTLLIDDFDVSSLLIREEEQRWLWFKRFLCDYVLNQRSSKVSIIPKKGANRDKLQDLSMFNKFLHYSLAAAGGTLDDSFTRSENDLTGCQDFENVSQQSASYDLTCLTPTKSAKQSPAKKASSLDLSPDFVERQLNRIDDYYGTSSSGTNSNESSSTSSYLRNLLWKFEDINMLVGSDMPIFGDSNHPAVSLRLSDMTRPINVLTGLDYWLDNLMCSVPEVIMCFHVDGIVQKYDLFKTDDIPGLSNPNFKPTVVRNIAQNILTFLKSKATKSGHTYWCYKGKNDDVVKLYDLSSLCFEQGSNENLSDSVGNSNPYSVPVAILLYRVAKNLRESSSTKTENRENSVYRLLENCLNLLKQDTSNYHRLEQVVCNAHFLLADVLVPTDMSSLSSDSKNKDEVDNDPFEDSTFEFDDEYLTGDSCPTSDDDSVHSLSVKTLTKDLPKEYCDKKKTTKKKKASDTIKLADKDWSARAYEALEHIVSGLEKLRLKADSFTDKTSPKKKPKDEEQVPMAKPFEPIPMGYAPLNSTVTGEQQIVANVSGPPKDVMAATESTREMASWKDTQQVLFFEKACHLFLFMAENEFKGQFNNRCLQFIKLGLICCEAVEKLNVKNSKEGQRTSKWLPSLLALAGDVQLLFKNEANETAKHYGNGKNDHNDTLVKYEERLFKLIDDLDLMEEYAWAVGSKFSFESSTEERMKLSARCYEDGITLLKEHKSIDLFRKLGNISNELGCYYMAQAMSTFQEVASMNVSVYNKLEAQTKASLSSLVKGIEAFDTINDEVNCGLLFSNTGKLMRVCAHVFAPLNADKSRTKEVSPKEKHFYHKCVHYYQLAYQRLVSFKDTLEGSNLWESLNWDLSTALFTFGCLLQDYAPLGTYAYEEVEKEICDYMIRSLQLCEKFVSEKNSTADCENARVVLYKYRIASIKLRLGSLYHHSFRNMAEGDSKRKQIFQLSDDYYQGAHEQFIHVNSSRKEILEALLERIGIHEHMLNSLTGFGSRVKAVETVVNILRSTKDIVEAQGEDDDEQEMLKLANIMTNRLVFCVTVLKKTLSTKSTKHKDRLKELNQLETELLASASKLTSINDKQRTSKKSRKWDKKFDKEFVSSCDKCLNILTKIHRS